MLKVNFKSLFVFLAVLLIIFAIWNDPSQSAETLSNFLGDLGDFLLDVIDKLTEFLRGLTA